MSDKIAEIRITLALNPKQIAERILSGEVTSDSHFVSQEDHLQVASLLDATHREIAKLRAEVERLRVENEELRKERDTAQANLFSLSFHFENWKVYNGTHALGRQIEELRAEIKRLRAKLEDKP